MAPTLLIAVLLCHGQADAWLFGGGEAAKEEKSCGKDGGECVLKSEVEVANNGDYESRLTIGLEEDLDKTLMAACKELGIENAHEECAPRSGARLVDSRGSRVLDITTLLRGKAAEPVYVVPRWLHFVWPTVKVGHVVEPSNVKKIKGTKPMTLKTLSLRPRVFEISNFMSIEEARGLIDINKPRLKRSTVGATASQDRTRTSSNTWDLTSVLSKRFKRRAFNMLGIDHDVALEDGLQVLNYQVDQYYKPHVDWLNSDTEDVEGNLKPKINNGTNRFATVFLYLNTVPKGGHTVFPRSYTHETFDGNKIMRDGPANAPPGYISDRDAAWACNTSSSALRSDPVEGNAVLFYSQLPDSELDVESLHGGCPPVKGEKWAVNLWVWNRPRIGMMKPVYNKGTKAQTNVPPGQISFEFFNKLDKDVDVFWLNPNGVNSKMATIKSNSVVGMNSFDSHEFGVTEIGKTEPIIWKHVVRTANKGTVVNIQL
ncbi:hypothetical protein AAMO2058_000481600 [Amorphochlora amoebiformis]